MEERRKYSKHYLQQYKEIKLLQNKQLLNFLFYQQFIVEEKTDEGIRYSPHPRFHNNDLNIHDIVTIVVALRALKDHEYNNKITIRKGRMILGGSKTSLVRLKDFGLRYTPFLRALRFDYIEDERVWETTREQLIETVKIQYKVNLETLLHLYN